MQSSEAFAHDRSFHPLTVARVVEETADAKSIVFAIPPPLRRAFHYEAGQFLTLEVEHEGARLRRCYSLASSPACEDEHKVTVKRVAGGRISNWVNDRVRAGDVISVLPPEGRFVLGRGDAPLLLFAGGSGITPVISLLKTALATTKRTARLVYANRDARSVIFAQELEALATRYPGRFEVVHRFDDLHGFVDAATVRSVLLQRDVDAYLCGPGPFMDTVERALLEAGLDRARVRVERFVSQSDTPKTFTTPASGTSPSNIAVTIKGKLTLVPYQPGQSLLRAALDAGLDAPYSCEEGFCGCCTAQLLAGKVEMAADDALTAEDKKRGLILTCQARPCTGECAVEYLDGP
ncbi:MAG TPA: ferredoxin--NADP reductase [Polyangiaceae bacterium]|jgi:3-ketosteroid 9alpha-monooxygenase subunit B